MARAWKLAVASAGVVAVALALGTGAPAGAQLPGSGSGVTVPGVSVPFPGANTLPQSSGDYGYHTNLGPYDAGGDRNNPVPHSVLPPTGAPGVGTNVNPSGNPAAPGSAGATNTSLAPGSATTLPSPSAGHTFANPPGALLSSKHRSLTTTALWVLGALVVVGIVWSLVSRLIKRRGQAHEASAA